MATAVGKICYFVNGLKKRKRNLKKIASMKVKAGSRLAIAEARVGELKSMPLIHTPELKICHPKISIPINQ